MIPYSTAELLMRGAKPLYEVKVEQQPKRVREFSRDYSNCGSAGARKCREKFAQHVETIKKMRQGGATWKQIGAKIRIPENTVSRYWHNNPDLFEP